jgi:hypothetical protein
MASLLRHATAGNSLGVRGGGERTRQYPGHSNSFELVPLDFVNRTDNLTPLSFIFFSDFHIHTWCATISVPNGTPLLCVFSAHPGRLIRFLYSYLLLFSFSIPGTSPPSPGRQGRWQCPCRRASRCRLNTRPLRHSFKIVSGIANPKTATE